MIEFKDSSEDVDDDNGIEDNDENGNVNSNNDNSVLEKNDGIAVEKVAQKSPDSSMKNAQTQTNNETSEVNIFVIFFQ